MTDSILIVDDSRVARHLLRSYVEEKFPTWLIYEASKAEEALNHLSTKGPTTHATIDINMEGMDGLELTEKVKQAYPEIQITIISGNIQNAIRKKAEELKTSFIEKPLSQESLDAVFAS